MTTNSTTYNGLDTRVGMTDSTGSRTFKRAGIGVTSPVLSDGSASFTPSGENRAGVKTAYHGGLKSFDTQTNSAQAVVGQRLTDAFGNQISSSGVWKGRFAYGGPYGYQEDPDTGLRLLGHRYYDSSTGRFLTRDPIKDGRNWYAYCENRPIILVDPSGLAPGDKYGTMEEAIAAAGNDWYEESVENMREYGGEVFKNSDGTWSYSVYTMLYRKLDLVVRKPKKGGVYWHTHWFESGYRVPLEVRPDPKNEGGLLSGPIVTTGDPSEPSTADKRFADEYDAILIIITEDYIVYVGPDGTVRKTVRKRK